MRLLAAALAAFLSVSTAQADTYECLPIAEADAWHQEREHVIVASRVGVAPSGMPFRLFLWQAPESRFYIVAIAMGALDACLVEVTALDPRLIDPAGLRL